MRKFGPGSTPLAASVAWLAALLLSSQAWAECSIQKTCPDTERRSYGVLSSTIPGNGAAQAKLQFEQEGCRVTAPETCSISKGWTTTTDFCIQICKPGPEPKPDEAAPASPPKGTRRARARRPAAARATSLAAAHFELDPESKCRFVSLISYSALARSGGRFVKEGRYAFEQGGAAGDQKKRNPASTPLFSLGMKCDKGDGKSETLSACVGTVECDAIVYGPSQDGQSPELGRIEVQTLAACAPKDGSCAALDPTACVREAKGKGGIEFAPVDASGLDVRTKAVSKTQFGSPPQSPPAAQGAE
jgi:hypothetical protein